MPRARPTNPTLTKEVQGIPHRKARSDIGEIRSLHPRGGSCRRPERNQCDDGQQEEDASQDAGETAQPAENSSPCFIDSSPSVPI